MASVAKLRYDSTDLSFLNTSGLYISADKQKSWIQKIAGIGMDGLPFDVEEIIPLSLSGATDVDDVATTEQALSHMMRYNNNYWRDPDRVTPVWLHSQVDDETGERRALVKNIKWRWLSPQYTGDMVGFKPNLETRIERVGAWEQTTASTAVETAAIAGIGGEYDYTAAGAADVVGTLPARLDYLYAWANANNLSVFWGGIRGAEKHGNLANYDPILDIASNFSPGTDASAVADANSRTGGNTMRVTFASEAGWASRAYGANNINPGQDESGDNLAILRARVSGGIVADVKLGFSNISVDGIAYTATQRIDAASYTFYPIQGLWNNDSNGAVPMVNVWAKRVSGSGGFLYLDCFVLIPVDEFFVFAEGTGALGNSAIGNALNIHTRADGVGMAYSGRLSANVENVEMEGPGIPIGDGRLVICAAGADRVSLNTDTLTLKMNHWQRWAGLRGAQ